LNTLRERPSRVVLVAAVGVLAAFFAGSAVAASQGGAVVTLRHSSHGLIRKFKQPKLKHGVLTITGTNASDKIALRLKRGKTGILEIDAGDDGSADFSFKRRRVARIAVNARAGADRVRIDERNGVFTDRIRTRIAGEAGNDTLLGGSGAETLLGGDGNDSIDGNGGNDLALLGAGDDTFVWDPGDGSDTVQGQDGLDTMRFNGANVAERVALSANGNGLRFTRDVAKITMDTNGVERVDFNALGGTDLVTVNDLNGTDVRAVNVDLAGTLGGATGDGQADRVILNATDNDDALKVNGDATEVTAKGLAPLVAIFHPEAANDRLEINTLAGNDTVDPAGLAAGAIQLFVDGVLVP
jgi:Ca2+-binding RTX toxin-like protein